MFSPWYGWKSTHLALDNNQSLTHYKERDAYCSVNYAYYTKPIMVIPSLVFDDYIITSIHGSTCISLTHSLPTFNVWFMINRLNSVLENHLKFIHKVGDHKRQALLFCSFWKLSGFCSINYVHLKWIIWISWNNFF